jgi:hypothetical protein
VRTTFFFVILALFGCAGPSSPASPAYPQESAPWPAADLLFRAEPRWLGGDAAYSIALDQGRVLWLFGDSFVTRAAGATRKDAVMVRNSVGVQTGSDPTTATFSFALPAAALTGGAAV